jgi:Ca2+-binding RTX toxin-like protein
LVTPALASQVTGAAEWHINTDEPRVLDYNTEFNPLGLYQPDVFRSSDHDPLVVGLELSSVAPAPTCGGITATVYVDGTNQIVGGPDDGRPYAGMLRGTAGNDVLVGTAGDDLIRGLGGEDVACGLAGHDAVLGGAANDVVYGGEGNDVLLGLGGADQLHGGAGTDLLEGGAGDDRLSGGDGSDVLSGSAGRDLCDGGPAPDVALSCEHRVSVP